MARHPQKSRSYTPDEIRFKLQELREQAGLTRMDCALLLGISKSQIVKYESGITLPGAAVIFTIKAAFGVGSVDDMFDVKNKDLKPVTA